MKIRSIILLFLIVTFTNTNSFSQTHSLTANHIYGLNPLLYNGQAYTFYPSPETKGSQFLDSSNFVNSSIQIRGEKFTDLLINYDVYNQLIVLRYKGRQNNLMEIVLPNAWIKSLDLGKKHFEVLSFPGKKSRIYQVIGKGHFQILYTWRKYLNLSDDPYATNSVFSKPTRQSFLKSGNKLTHYRNNKSFITLFNPEYKSKLKRYLRKHRIKLNRLKKSGLPAIHQLINYCNTLSEK